MANFYRKLNRKKRFPLPRWKETPITPELEARFKRTKTQKRYKGVFGTYRLGYDVMKHLVKKALWK